jgi:carbon storage regulator
MLALSRKTGEKVVIGNGITLVVVEVRGGRVRLAFDAPDQVRILRAELACRQAEPLDAGLGENAWNEVSHVLRGSSG